ncbi:MAG: thiamine phosphate synthase [Paludibacteraceae bacterium]|nr:thiamine phosphate synthase [Paludibacteraceae bacterium]
MQKIIITYPTNFIGEPEQIKQVLQDENVILHLRKPDATEAEYEALLQAIPATFHKRVVLHDYYHLQKKYDVGGFHFSTKKRAEISNLVDWRIDKLSLSTSTHSLEELEKLDVHFDYAFLSPIFPSISKQGYEGNLDMQAVQRYLQKPHHTKVIALGGIDERKMPQSKEWGFDGIAMLGSIWMPPPAPPKEGR